MRNEKRNLPSTLSFSFSRTRSQKHHPMADAALAGGSDALMGKGAWDCDAGRAIPPDKEVCVLEGVFFFGRGVPAPSIGKNGRGIFSTPHPFTKTKQAEVFEEVPTMDFPFHGMPTVPPRKDMAHMVCERERERGDGRRKQKKEREAGCITAGALTPLFPFTLFFPLTPHPHKAFFCRGVRYRVTAHPDWTAARVKAALWAGGLGRGPSSSAVAGGGGTGKAASPAPPPPPPPRRPPAGPEDYTLVYAGRAIPDGARLADCGVPPVSERGAMGEREGEGWEGWSANPRLSRTPLVFHLFPSSSHTQGCQALIAIETARLEGPPSPTSPYWD
jgi:hypothetical protein